MLGVRWITPVGANMKRWMLWVILTSLVVAAPVAAQEGESQSGLNSGGASAADGEAAGDSETDSDGEKSVDASVNAEEAKDEKLIPINASLNVNSSFGAATLLSNTEFTQTDYFRTGVNVGLSYNIIDELSVSTGIGYSKFLTDNGGRVFQREGRVSDVGLNFGWSGWTEENTGISISGGGGFNFPVSTVSRTVGLVVGTSAGLSLRRSFGGLNFSYSLGGGKDFHRFTSVTLPIDDLDVIARAGGEENVGAGLVALDGVLGEWSISNSFGLSFGFLDGFSASIGLSFIDFWTYDNGTITQDDEFVNPNAVVGRGHGQAMTGSMRLGYRIAPWLSASAAMVTNGAPLAADNRSLRFPFWDFENGQASRTSFSLGLGASY